MIGEYIMFKKSLLFSLILLKILFNVYSEEKPIWAKQKILVIAVLGFDNFVDSEDINTDVLTELLQDALVSNSNYMIVERNQVDRIIKEKKFQLSGITDENQLKSIGSLLNAEKIVVGTVSKMQGKYIVIIKGIDIENGIIEFSDKMITYSKNSIIDNIPKLADRFIKKSYGEKIENSDVLIIEDTNILSKNELSEISDELLQNYRNQIISMIDNKDYRNTEKKIKIQNLAKYLTNTDKALLYSQHKVNGPLGLLNILYGLGSWLQGDYLNGAIVSGTMVTGFIFTMLGTNTDSVNNGSAIIPNGSAIGMGFIFAGMIYGVIVPWIFANVNNNNLKDALLYHDPY